MVFEVYKNGKGIRIYYEIPVSYCSVSTVVCNSQVLLPVSTMSIQYISGLNAVTVQNFVIVIFKLFESFTCTYNSFFFI